MVDARKAAIWRSMWPVSLTAGTTKLIERWIRDRVLSPWFTQIDTKEDDDLWESACFASYAEKDRGSQTIIAGYPKLE
jgi:hypothetical protein